MQEANVNNGEDFLNSIPPTPSNITYINTYPNAGDSFERNYAKMTVHSFYYFKKLLPNIYFDFALLSTKSHDHTAKREVCVDTDGKCCQETGSW